MAKKKVESQNFAEEFLSLGNRKAEKISFTVRMNKTLKEKMENAADDTGVSINSFINTLVEAELRRRGYL